MGKNRLSETIAAIATGITSSGGVSIIRISGSKSLNIFKTIFKTKKKIKNYKPRYLYYGDIIDNDKVLDSGMGVYFKAPNSFTGEDIVELHIHGGYHNSKNVLELIINKGAIPAEKGEFTERAFINGKIDLVQAESIVDIINSRNRYTHNNAVLQLKGSLSETLQNIKDKLFNLTTIVEASIDFPDEDYNFIEDYGIKDKIEKILPPLIKLSKSYYDGKIFYEGAKIAIAGAPNVGKSSLMNQLLKTDRALITDIEGTTRDYIEAEYSIKGIPVTIIDTAGLRETDDIIEKEGVKKAIEKVKEADFTIFLLDKRGFTEDILKIYNSISENKKVVVQNKIDLYSEKIDKYVDISISAKKGISIDKLEEFLYSKLVVVEFSSDQIFITNSRHKKHIDLAIESLNEVKEGFYNEIPLDLLSPFLRKGLSEIGAILGEVTTEDILGNIFSNFCIGK